MTSKKSCSRFIFWEKLLVSGQKRTTICSTFGGLTAGDKAALPKVRECGERNEGLATCIAGLNVTVAESSFALCKDRAEVSTARDKSILKSIFWYTRACAHTHTGQAFHKHRGSECSRLRCTAKSS